MTLQKSHVKCHLATVGILFLMGCSNISSKDNFAGLKVKVLVGSAMSEFCTRAAEKFNATQPKLDNGTNYRIECTAEGSGDVVSEIVSIATQYKNGTIKADSEEFPTIISVDGEIYQSQLIDRINRLFPGQNYIPEITESPLLAYSPLVFMVPNVLASSLRKSPNPYQALTEAKTFRDLDPSSEPIPIKYVHTAPTKSNSGMLTLVAQFASKAGKRPEQLTVADVQKYRPQIQQLQSKITRYGVSTDSLSKTMVKNGFFWASVASVYESSVIAANSEMQQSSQGYEAVYPKATFTSNMRAILPNAPWVSSSEKTAAEKFISYMRSPSIQKIATDLGLRPGTPGVELGPKFSNEYGVEAQAKYDSLRPPKPEVVEAMLSAWQEFAKKPSQVVIVVDSSGSMSGDKLPAVQQSLQNYINNLGPKEQIALIDFDLVIREPVLVDGTPQGKERGMMFISNLEVEGGTKLYDAVVEARNWLERHYRPDAINAILVLTDGKDEGSSLSLDRLVQESRGSSDRAIGVFTIGYGKDGEFDGKALKTIAEASGGYYSKGDSDTILRLMSDLQVEF